MVVNVRRHSQMPQNVVCVHRCNQDFTTSAKPFEHQVGGHTSLLSFANDHLLKPCAAKEINVYRNLPRSFRTFVPRCCAVIEGTHLDTLPGCCSKCDAQVEDINLPRNFEISPRLSPEHTPTDSEQDFIVMQDLTAGFVRPCVLDLKLGTRQFGDDASPQKMISQTQKCHQSTSAKEGIRLCGMQYYDHDTDTVVHVNKYSGRRMSREQLEDTVHQFFSGNESAAEVVREKISAIAETLSISDGVRLFGSSLLIIIESALSKSRRTPEVRIVDFANSTLPLPTSSVKYVGPDEGCLLGLRSLDNIIAKML